MLVPTNSMMGSIQERFRIEMILHQQPVCLKMGMNHNKENGKISNGGKSGKYSLSEPSTFFCKNLAHCCFFRVQTTSNVVHATGVKTAHFVRVTQTHIFLVLCTRDSRAGRIINAHALAQECLEWLSLCGRQKSLFCLLFRRALLGVPDPFPSFVPSTSCTAFTATDGNECKCLRRSTGRFIVWPAEQSPLTGYEPKSVVEVSSEHTPINFHKERTASTQTSTTSRPQWLHLEWQMQ